MTTALVIPKATLQNAATGTGLGTVFSFDRLYRNFTFNKRVTGVFTTLVINYEGSIDGVNWYPLASDNTLTAAPTFVVDKPSLHVRANITTFASGTSVTVDVAAGN